MQQGDVRLFHTLDDGNITVVGGLLEMHEGLETCVYLALFGGNKDDDGRDENKFNWWGNLSENEKIKQYRSETQYQLFTLPAISSNLIKIKDAIKRDLQFIIDEKIAEEIDILVSMVSVNKIKIVINVNGVGLEFLTNWGNK